MVHSNRSTRGHCGLKLSTKVKPWSNKHHPQCHWMSCKVFRMSKGWLLLKWLSQNVVKVLLFRGTVVVFCQLLSLGVSTADHLPPSHPISTNLFCQPTLWISSFTISMDLLLVPASFFLYNKSIIPPLYMLFNFVSKPLNLRCIHF